MDEKKVNEILQQTKEIYDLIAPDFSNTRGRWWQGFGDFNKYVKPGNKVLDVGCGNGRMAEIFLDSQIQYLGIDDSKELIKIAKQRFKDNSEINFVVDNALTLNVEADSYDLALLIAVLHHIPQKDLRIKILKNIYRVIKPGGRLVISTWNLFKFRYFKKYFLHSYNLKNKIHFGAWSIKDFFVPWKKSGAPQPRYTHAFTKGEIRKLLIQTGFEIEEIYYEYQGKPVSIFKGRNLLVVAKK